MGNQQSSSRRSAGVPVQELHLDRPALEPPRSYPEAVERNRSRRTEEERRRTNSSPNARSRTSTTTTTPRIRGRSSRRSWSDYTNPPTNNNHHHHHPTTTAQAPSPPITVVDLEHVQTAWRSFKGWDTRKLSLGMDLQAAEWQYLVRQMKPLPPCFRPKKLHFWDNQSQVQLRQVTRDGQPQEQDPRRRTVVRQQQEDALEFVQLCQANVHELELHGFGRVPPLSQLLELPNTTNRHLSAASPDLFQWTNLKSLRLYHMDLREESADDTRGDSGVGRLIRTVFLEPTSKTNTNSTVSPLLDTLSLSRCHVDDETIGELAKGIPNLLHLKTLIVVHCQLKDTMLQELFASLVAIHKCRQQQQRKDEEGAMLRTRYLIRPGGGSVDVCFHANQLTLLSLSLLCDTLVEYPSIIRSITLHSNPAIANSIGASNGEGLSNTSFLSQYTTLDHGDQSTAVEDEWVHLWKVLNDRLDLALRHLTWHECRRAPNNISHRTGRIRNQQQLEEERGGSQVVVCDACQRLQQIFRRNQWWATSNQLVAGVEQCTPSLWPRMIKGKSPTTLFGLIRGKHVELLEAAKQHSRSLNCLCPTCRVGGIGWCCRQEMQTFDIDNAVDEEIALPEHSQMPEHHGTSLLLELHQDTLQAL